MSSGNSISVSVYDGDLTGQRGWGPGGGDWGLCLGSACSELQPVLGKTKAT